MGSVKKNTLLGEPKMGLSCHQSCVSAHNLQQRKANVPEASSHIQCYVFHVFGVDLFLFNSSRTVCVRRNNVMIMTNNIVARTSDPEEEVQK